MSDPVQPKYTQFMNKIARAIDEAFNGKRKPGKEPTVGFVLLVAEFNKIEDGRVNYISNGERADMIAMMKEYIARAEGRYSETGGRA